MSESGTMTRGMIHGVGAQRGWRGLPGGVTTGVIPGSSIGIGYFGGPVLSCPQIYAGFWGSSWWGTEGPNVYQTTLQPQLTQFLKDLPNSTFMNVLSQYGAGGGAGVAGTFMQAHNLAITGTAFTVADVQSWIQILIDFNDMPDASRASSAGKVCIVIFLDDTIEINDPGFNGGADGGIVMCEPGSDTAFGFHWAFTTTSGNQMYFAVVGACDDTCLGESCPDPSNCTLQTSQSQLDRLTQVASHEIAEMMTDPAPFSGWVPEIGDPCGGVSDSITVGPNTWNVQKIYSLAADLAHEPYCQGTAPASLPAQPGGPGASTHAMTGYRPGHLDRILPLPTARINSDTKAISYEERELRRFVNRVIMPATVNDLPGHFAQLLRETADHIDTRTGRTTRRRRSGRRKRAA